MLKRLYDKCVDLAGHRYSKPLLGFFSFIESSFFPIPPDVMIIPMTVAKKYEYLKIFLIATIFSVLGALFGYFIGYVFFNEIGIKIFEIYGYEDPNFLKEKFSSKGGFFSWLGILFTAGFTPLPFKLLTISSGFIHFNLLNDLSILNDLFKFQNFNRLLFTVSLEKKIISAFPIKLILLT